MMPKLSNIEHPHEHDVLSGRGNFVNYHVGNEYFRTLVRKHKLEYVRCPKPQKGKFSRIIVDEIKARDPPGRFLKQDASTKLWYDIGDKKALDKTRQALREGAPEIVKEITGDTSSAESDDDDGPPAVRTDGYNIRSSETGGSQFMNSPTRSRNGLPVDPRLQSPVGMLSPSLLMDPLSPEMDQYSGTARGGGLRHMMDPSVLPGPPLQTLGQFDAINQMKAQQQAALMMNVQMSNNFRSNLGVPGMMSQEQIEMQNHIQQQQMQFNLLQQIQQQHQQLQQQQQQLQQQQLRQQQLQQQHAHMKNVHANVSSNEIRMMNMASMSMNSQVVTPMPGQSLSVQNLTSNQFDLQPINEMLPPRPVLSGTPTPQHCNAIQQTSSQQHVVETLPGNNPRRMPPPSLLKREDSIKMEKVFAKSPTPGYKNKVDSSNASSNHLSAMSLSIADMQEEGNLSSVFDSSMRISNSSNNPSKRKTREKDASSFEMSEHTIGLNTAGDMSYATFTEGHESEGDMSFGKVFEDPKD